MEEPWSRRAFIRAVTGAIPACGTFAPVRPGGGAQGSDEWGSLFDGPSLGGWEETPFGGEGLVRIVNGTIVLEFGEPLTGITWRGPPRADPLRHPPGGPATRRP